MRNVISSAGLAACALLSSAALSPSAYALGDGADLLAALEARGRSETFLAMLEQAGLREGLEASDDALTMIVPTDRAFRSVQPETVARLFAPDQRETLRQILRHHLVSGAQGGSDLAVAGTVTSRAGVPLRFALLQGRLCVEGQALVSVDVPTDSGALHEIDTILLPDPSALEPTPARRVAARALRAAAGPDLTDAARIAVLQTALAAAIELEPDAGLPADLLAPGARPGPEAAPERVLALREALLSLFDAQSRLAFTMQDSSQADAATPLVRFDGSDADPSWFTLNDDVMGGISTSRIQLVGAEGESDGRLVFSGKLSLENNGGFASIRSSAQDYDLTGYAGLRLRVKTDGREYGVSALAGDERGRTGSWRKRFKIPAGEWTTVDIPFEDMVLNIRGRQYPDVGPPDQAKIRSFSFIIGDKDVSPFQMEIESVSAYGKKK